MCELSRLSPTTSAFARLAALAASRAAERYDVDGLGRSLEPMSSDAFVDVATGGTSPNASSWAGAAWADGIWPFSACSPCPSSPRPGWSELSGPELASTSACPSGVTSTAARVSTSATGGFASGGSPIEESSGCSDLRSSCRAPADVRLRSSTRLRSIPATRSSNARSDRRVSSLAKISSSLETEAAVAKSRSRV